MFKPRLEALKKLEVYFILIFGGFEKHFNFQFHEHVWENLFKANYYLRRAGITPSSPGKHPVADRFKRYAYTAVQDLRRKVKRDPVILSHNEARRQYHRILEIVGSR